MRRHSLAPIVVSLALAAPSLADDGADCLAWNQDGAFAADVTTVGVTRAVRLDVPSNLGSVTVVQARLFTGLVTAPSSLGLRAHVPGSNAPGAVLGESTFTVKSNLGWQGVAFDVPVPLAAGETFWLTWDAPAGAQMPWSPPKAFAGQAHRISYDGGKTWVSQVFQSSASHFKVRLQGACGCATDLQTHGSGCAGSGGHVPTLLTTSCPTVGTDLGVVVAGGLGGAWSLVVLGDHPASQPLFGTDCDLLLDPVRLPLLVQPLAGHGAGEGTVSLWGKIDSSVSGESLVVQAFVLDPGVPRGFSASAGLRISIP